MMTRIWNACKSLNAGALLQVEKPTVRMTFSVNTSPFAGREGKYVTSRNIKDRLDRELERNLALTVEPGETADQFVVSGRGALHISILIENMRREGFEFQVGPPRVSHNHSLKLSAWLSCAALLIMVNGVASYCRCFRQVSWWV